MAKLVNINCPAGIEVLLSLFDRKVTPGCHSIPHILACFSLLAGRLRLSRYRSALIRTIFASWIKPDTTDVIMPSRRAEPPEIPRLFISFKLVKYYLTHDPIIP